MTASTATVTDTAGFHQNPPELTPTLCLHVNHQFTDLFSPLYQTFAEQQIYSQVHLLHWVNKSTSIHLPGFNLFLVPVHLDQTGGTITHSAGLI